MKRSILYFLILVIVGLLVSYVYTYYIANDGTNEELEKGKIKISPTIQKNETTGDIWPNSEFTRQLPRPTKGELTIKVYGRSRISFTLEGLELKDYYDYIEATKKAGFVNKASERNGYIATNEEGYMIRISYNEKTKFLSVDVF